MSATQFRVLGMDGVNRALGILASAFSDQDLRTINGAIIRPASLPGSSEPIVRKGFTLEEQAVDAFASEGRTRLNGGWDAYGAEPRYAEYKDERGGGSKVGTWDGSQRPLRDTFVDRTNPDHIETVGGDGFRWGSGREYAGGFHFGQFQSWDNVQAPARFVFVVDDKFSREVARGYQRYIVYKLRLEGSDIRNVRVVL